MEGKHFKLSAILLCLGLVLSCGTSQSTRHENFIIQSMIDDVRDEKLGRPLNTSDRNWNDYWAWRVRNMRKTPDGERYARMAIEMRRSAGLPELRMNPRANQ